MNAPDRYVAFIMIVESTSPNALRSVVWSCGRVVVGWHIVLGECWLSLAWRRELPRRMLSMRLPCVGSAQVKAKQVPRSCALFIAQKRRDAQLSHCSALYETSPTHDIATKQTCYHAKLGGRISLGGPRDGPRTPPVQAAQDQKCTQSRII